MRLFDLTRHSGNELTQHSMSKNVYFMCREKNRYQWKSVFCSSPNSDNTLGGPKDTGVSANYFSLFVLLLNTVILFVQSMSLLNLGLFNVTADISQTLQCTKLGTLSLCSNLKILRNMSASHLFAKVRKKCLRKSYHLKSKFSK